MGVKNQDSSLQEEVSHIYIVRLCYNINSILYIKKIIISFLYLKIDILVCKVYIIKLVELFMLFFVRLPYHVNFDRRFYEFLIGK